MLKNKINNKVYIGQTIRELNVRVNKHIMDAKAGSSLAIHRAIRKYGIENFEIIILEDNINQGLLNDREIYYISFYDSTKKERGYNLSKGGSKGRVSKYSDETILKVKEYLRNSSLSIPKISHLTGVPDCLIYDINRGRCLLDVRFPTPIREIKKQKRLDLEIVLKIIEDLKLGIYTLTELSEKYDCSIITVSRINMGKIHHCNDLKYPLMKTDNIHRDCLDSETIKSIIQLLEKSELSIREISRKLGIPEGTITDINMGRTWKSYWSGKYPIRKFNWITKQQVLCVIDLVKNTKLPIKDICKKAGVSTSIYYTIVNGEHFYCKDLNETFPLASRNRIQIPQEIQLEIKSRYFNNKESITRISKDVGYSYYVIKKYIESIKL